MVSELLYNIGLPLKEAKIYDYLVRNGVSSVLTMSRQLKLSRSSVYSSLGSLREKSLVMYDNSTNSWAALQFDDFAEMLMLDLRFLKSKLGNVNSHANIFNMVFDSSVSKNRIVFNKTIVDSKKTQTFVICSLNSFRNSLFSSLNLKNIRFITDKPLGFDCARNLVKSDCFFYDKLVLVLADNTAYLFLDEFRFLIKVRDINLIDYLKSFYLKN